MEGTCQTSAPGFFPCFLDLIAFPIDSFIFFDSLCSKSVAVLQLRPSRAEGHVRIHVSSHSSWCYLACFTKCDGTARVQLLVSRNPFSGGFPWIFLAMLSTLCPQAAPSSGWSLGLCTWSRLNQTLCFFQAISLIVEIILNSVLACRILAIPCSFSLHQ